MKLLHFERTLQAEIGTTLACFVFTIVWALVLERSCVVRDEYKPPHVARGSQPCTDGTTDPVRFSEISSVEGVGGRQVVLDVNILLGAFSEGIYEGLQMATVAAGSPVNPADVVLGSDTSGLPVSIVSETSFDCGANALGFYLATKYSTTPGSVTWILRNLEGGIIRTKMEMAKPDGVGATEFINSFFRMSDAETCQVFAFMLQETIAKTAQISSVNLQSCEVQVCPSSVETIGTALGFGTLGTLLLPTFLTIMLFPNAALMKDSNDMMTHAKRDLRSELLNLLVVLIISLLLFTQVFSDMASCSLQYKAMPVHESEFACMGTDVAVPTRSSVLGDLSLAMTVSKLETISKEYLDGLTLAGSPKNISQINLSSNTTAPGALLTERNETSCGIPIRVVATAPNSLAFTLDALTWSLEASYSGFDSVPFEALENTVLSMPTSEICDVAAFLIDNHVVDELEQASFSKPLYCEENVCMDNAKGLALALGFATLGSILLVPAFMFATAKTTLFGLPNNEPSVIYARRDLKIEILNSVICMLVAGLVAILLLRPCTTIEREIIPVIESESSCFGDLGPVVVAPATTTAWTTEITFESLETFTREDYEKFGAVMESLTGRNVLQISAGSNTTIPTLLIEECTGFAGPITVSYFQVNSTGEIQFEVFPEIFLRIFNSARPVSPELFNALYFTSKDQRCAVLNFFAQQAFGNIETIAKENPRLCLVEKPCTDSPLIMIGAALAYTTLTTVLLAPTLMVLFALIRKYRKQQQSEFQVSPTDDEPL